MLVAAVVDLVLQALYRTHDQAQRSLDLMGQVREEPHLHLFNLNEMLHPLPDEQDGYGNQ